MNKIRDNFEVPKHFTYLDSFVLPKKMEKSRRALDEHIDESIRFKYFLKLKNRRELHDHLVYKSEDFPVLRLVYLLIWKSPSGTKHTFKVGQSQKCFQRIGKNYLVGTGANTGWLSPAMYAFLKERGGEFEIFYRGFDDKVAKVDGDIEVEYTPRLDTIEKHYQKTLNIKDGKAAVQEFFKNLNFKYVIK
jgi:hypothetical protein